MSEVLYRKHRPRTFDDIKGQQTTVKILKQAVKSDKISHAYLFAGPRGTGKTSMARLLAKAVNDPEFSKRGDIDPDHPVSKAIEQGNFLDLIEIDAASNRGIEEIRQLRDKVNFAPTQGDYKVYIIDEVHMLTREAFNALLKTLEEPPAHVIFVLATTEPHKLPITILSRVQRFNFGLANPDELKMKINQVVEGEGYTITEDAHELIYQQSEGSFRDAESLLEKIISTSNPDQDQIDRELVEQALGLASTEQIEIFIAQFQNDSLEDAIHTVRSLKQSGLGLDQFIKQVIEYIRDKLIERGTNSSKADLLLMNKLMGIVGELRNFSDTQLLLEVFLIESLTMKQTDGQSMKEVERYSPKEKAAQTKSAKKEGKNQKNVSAKKNTQSNPNESAGELISSNNKSQLLKKIKLKGFQLWSALKLASIKLNQDTVTVEVNNKSAKDTIQKGDNLELVTQEFKKVLSKSELQLEITVVDNSDVGENSTSQNQNNLIESNEQLVEEILG